MVPVQVRRHFIADRLRAAPCGHPPLGSPARGPTGTEWGGSFDASGKEAVKVLADLTATIACAEQQIARSPGGNQVLFVHGPLPRLSGNPAKDQVWHISEELPVKGWPTSGSYFKDPIP